MLRVVFICSLAIVLSNFFFVIEGRHAASAADVDMDSIRSEILSSYQAGRTLEAVQELERYFPIIINGYGSTSKEALEVSSALVKITTENQLYDKAERYCKETIKILESNNDQPFEIDRTWLLLSTIYLQQNKPNEALSASNKAVEMAESRKDGPHPYKKTILMNNFIISLRNKNVAQAKANIEKVLKDTPLKTEMDSNGQIEPDVPFELNVFAAAYEFENLI